MDDVMDKTALWAKLPDNISPRAFEGGSRDLRISWPMLRRAETSAVASNQAVVGPLAQGAVDMLRTKVAATMQENKWTTLAVTAPTARCGTTTLAVGLATSLARQRETRVLLFDFNLRKPGIARQLGLKGQFNIGDLLDGSADTRDCLVRRSDNFAIAPNSNAIVNPAETLYSTAAAAAVQRVQAQLAPNFVIFDFPPMLEHDDLLGFLPFVDQVLLVLGAERTSFGQADVCERDLSGRGKLLGVVLNQCQLGLGAYDV